MTTGRRRMRNNVNYCSLKFPGKDNFQVSFTFVSSELKWQRITSLMMQLLKLAKCPIGATFRGAKSTNTE